MINLACNKMPLCSVEYLIHLLKNGINPGPRQAANDTYLNYLEINSIYLFRNRHINNMTCAKRAGRQRKQGISGMAFSAKE
jgi:hypothetical protein